MPLIVQSDENPAAITIIFSELFRSTTFFLFEEAIEIRDIIKATIVCNFGNRLRSIDQQS